MTGRKRNVFRNLLIAMITFGLAIGLVFPFLIDWVLQSSLALSPSFVCLCLGAGLLVGLVNYLLFHMVISRELDRIITAMQTIGTLVGRSITSNDPVPHNICQMEVTSEDRLGRVIEAFNEMGRVIDERQQRERELREVMTVLSDSVDLDFVSQVILTHIPAPPAWRHALLYILQQGSYVCLARMKIQPGSEPQTIGGSWLRSLLDGGEEFMTMEAAGTPLGSLKIISADNSVAPVSHINVAPLHGDAQVLGIIVTACAHFHPMDDNQRARCRNYCDHVQPYLRSTLLHRQVQELATLDELSRVMNRRAGMLRLEEQLALARRHTFPLSLIMLDIDHFKMVNDLYGHLTGDAIIQELCQRLKKNLRQEDQIFRYGGEEFIVFLPHIDLTGAVLCAERLRSAMREMVFSAGEASLSIQISLGVVTAGPDLRKPDSLIALADQALYRAKERGRDQVVVHCSGQLLTFQEFLETVD